VFDTARIRQLRSSSFEGFWLTTLMSAFGTKRTSRKPPRMPACDPSRPLFNRAHSRAHARSDSIAGARSCCPRATWCDFVRFPSTRLLSPDDPFLTNYGNVKVERNLSKWGSLACRMRARDGGSHARTMPRGSAVGGEGICEKICPHLASSAFALRACAGEPKRCGGGPLLPL
jgi:hypothetical protein